MRKIIGFKLALRAHEVKRRAKKARLDLAALGLGTDAALQKMLDETAGKLAPGVLFDTFKHPDADAAELSPLPGLAYSLILATLGEGFTALQAQAEPAAAPLWEVLRQAALDETVRFASALLCDEAAKDVCELSPLSALGPAAMATVLRKLEGSKIGVSLGEGGLQPGASAAVSLSWLSKSKPKAKGR